MHPPLYKPHPLCKKEVEDLVRCHEENPFMKFLNACGDVKITLDRCFREEKKLRVKLNRRQGDAASPVMLLDSPPRLPSNGPAAAPSGEPPTNIRVDVAESDTAYTVKADVPGADKDALKCEIDEDEGSVTISYERSQELNSEAGSDKQPQSAAAAADAKQRARSAKAEDSAELQESDAGAGSALAEPTWHVTERAWGRVSRTVALPEDAEWSKAEAKLEHGELTLNIPRRKPEAGEGARARRRALTIA